MVNETLKKSSYYDPNMDYLTCMVLTVGLTMAVFIIIIPLFTVLLTANNHPNWVIWLILLLILMLLVLLIAYCLYRIYVVREEIRMVMREKDFAYRLNIINRALNERGERRSWQTGPRGAFLQYNKYRSSFYPAIVDSPILEQF